MPAQCSSSPLVNCLQRSRYWLGVWVKTCMRVVLIQAKNGLSAFTALSMNLNEAWVNSTSTFSMRLRVSGPVSSQRCLPHLPKRGSSPGWPSLLA
ncbi:hypothetical protein D3C81_1964260 [compost metagenome]